MKQEDDTSIIEVEANFCATITVKVHVGNEVTTGILTEHIRNIVYEKQGIVPSSVEIIRTTLM